MNPKEKELHSVARNKVVTNPRAKSIPRKIKDVMTHGETQDVARSPACRRMKTNLREPYQGSIILLCTEDQFHRRIREPEVERLREIRGEPEKRADHGRRSAREQSQVMAKSQEAGRREARSRSISHRRNLSASWDRDSPPPPPAPVVREERVNPKEKELHSVSRNKVVTNPRAKFIPRKVKDVMTHGETQDVARSPACRRMKTNLKEPYTPPRVPSRPVESPPPPPPRTAGEENVKPGEKELHSVARSKVKTNPWTRSKPRKIKDVMTHEETQGVADSPSVVRKSRSTRNSAGLRARKNNQTQAACPQTPVKKAAGPRSLAAEPVHIQVAGGKLHLGRPGPTHTHTAVEPLSLSAKDWGTLARVANPYSEGEESDRDDGDYTMVGDGGESLAESEADTLVPGAVQHVRQTGYPSPQRVKKNKAVKKSVDVNEKPNRKKGRKLGQYNPKPTKAQLLAEPITHRLYFRAAQDFTRPKLERNERPNLQLHKLLVEVTTPCGARWIMKRL